MIFYKYQGTGNDFVMIDDRSESFPLDNLDHIRLLCNRNFGVGADGLILIRTHEELDFEMIYFNADGSKSFCGNGSRCAVKFASQLGIIGSSTKFLSTDGVHVAKILDDGRVMLDMHNVKDIKSIDQNSWELNTGSPHYIRFVERLEDKDIYSFGREIRYSPVYQENGINVNLVTETGEKDLTMQTYERGVENETLSCGTGVTAAALAYAYAKNISDFCKVSTKGGALEVRFERVGEGFENIVLIGPAELVFKGEWFDA